MLRPLRGSFRRHAIGAHLVLMMCACGRLGFEQKRTEESEVGSDAGGAMARPEAGVRDPMGLRDAGLRDAAAPGSDGGDAAQLPSCPAGALMCEGFEASIASWTFTRSEGTATASTQDSRSGSGSLQLSTRSAGASAYLERSFGPISVGALHVRFFAKVPGGTTIDGYDVVMLTNDAEDGGVAVALTDTTLSLSGLAAGTTSRGTLPHPRNEWVCIEVGLPLAPLMGVSVDLDGVRDPALLAEEGLPNGGYGRVAVGIVRSLPTQAPTDILIDDLVVATDPIGCD
jgi:hypothetical protein